MCGLLALARTPWQAGAEQGLAALASRGPDAQRVWRDGDVALGHARLSIIDLVTGDQPMAAEERSGIGPVVL